MAVEAIFLDFILRAKWACEPGVDVGPNTPRPYGLSRFDYLQLVANYVNDTEPFNYRQTGNTRLEYEVSYNGDTYVNGSPGFGQILTPGTLSWGVAIGQTMDGGSNTVPNFPTCPLDGEGPDNEEALIIRTGHINVGLNWSIYAPGFLAQQWENVDEVWLPFELSFPDGTDQEQAICQPSGEDGGGSDLGVLASPLVGYDFGTTPLSWDYRIQLGSNGDSWAYFKTTGAGYKITNIMGKDAET